MNGINHDTAAATSRSSPRLGEESGADAVFSASYALDNLISRLVEERREVVEVVEVVERVRQP